MRIMEKAKQIGQVIKTRQGFVPKWIHEEAGRLWYYCDETDDVVSSGLDGRRFLSGDDPLDLVLMPVTQRIWYVVNQTDHSIAGCSAVEPRNKTGWLHIDVELK